MKKYILTLAAFIVTAIASAQVDTNENPQSDQQDKIQQEPPRPSQKEAEITAKRTAQTEFQNKKAVEATEKQEAKRKAMKERAKSKQQSESTK